MARSRHHTPAQGLPVISHQLVRTAAPPSKPCADRRDPQVPPSGETEDRDTGWDEKKNSRIFGR